MIIMTIMIIMIIMIIKPLILSCFCHLLFFQPYFFRLSLQYLFVLLLYVTIILLFYFFYADMPIIHCLLISEMYSCNF